MLVLCSVGALWCFVRALEGGATKWLVAAGVLVGLGFEAKMGAALLIVPGMALAWLWVAPRGRAVAIKQLVLAGAALVAVALAWPVLVWLTPASSRPWISGTSDNSIWSLIWEYNGFGRLEGQTGGPASFGGAGGGPFGGETGVFRLLNESLGGQAGWLLGAALVGGIGIAALSRLRRTDPRTGWTIAVGGAFAVTAIAFSFAGGIFHPYYTSLLALFAAALLGATVGQVLAGERGGLRPAAMERERDRDTRLATVTEEVTGTDPSTDGDSLHAAHQAVDRSGPVATRMLGALALGAGAIVELVVIANGARDLDWLVAPLVIVTIAASTALLFADALAERVGSPTASATRLRMAALACGVCVLLVGPAVWSVETLGHPTSGTFPAGGPESASMMGGPGGGGGFGGPGGITGGGSGSGGASSFGPGATKEGEHSEGTQLPEIGQMPERGELPEGGAMPGMGELPEGGALPEMGELPEGSIVPGVGEMPGGGATSESGGLPGGGAMPGTSGTGGPPSMGGAGGTIGGGPGGMFGGEDMSAVVEYTEAHGGGTIAVDSQSGAAASIIEEGAEVAGIGGFSGKESTVSAEWLEARIEAGEITWIYTSGIGGITSGPTSQGGAITQSGSGEIGAGRGETGAGFPPGGPSGGDTRTGSESAIDTVVKQCTAVDSSAYNSTSSTSGSTGESATAEAVGGASGSGILYKCGES